jgi:hypothetical protein
MLDPTKRLLATTDQVLGGGASGLLIGCRLNDGIGASIATRHTAVKIVQIAFGYVVQASQQT